MNASQTTPPDFETILAALEQLPPEQRAEAVYRLLDGLYLSDLPDDRELRGEAEREDLKRRLGIQVRRVLECSAAWNNPPPDPSRIDTSRRAPRVRGTRITIFAIIDFLIHGWGASQVSANFPRVLPEDVVAAADYIAGHLDQVVADYQSILERHRNHRYPPDVQRKLDEAHDKFLKRVAEIREKRPQELTHAADHVGS